MTTQQIFVWIRTHKFWALLVLGALGYGVYLLIQPSVSTQSAATQSKVTPVKRGALTVTVSGSGQVEALAQVDLKPVAAGDAIEVRTVAVKNDQSVKKGQIIAVLDNEDALRAVEKARLDVQRASIQMKQTSTLYNNQTVHDTRERQLQHVALAQSQIALADALSRLGDYTIRAPFDGIVTGLSVESGDTVSQTGVLASVITQDMRVAITLNEVDAARVTVGTPVSLHLDALPDMTMTGSIAKLDTIGTTTQGVVSYGAEITLDTQDRRLKPGMSAIADITVAKKDNVLLVPAAAIATDSEGKAFAQVQTKNADNALTLSRRSIQTGLSDGVVTEVLDGLKEGERVIETSTTASTGSNTNGPNGAGFLNMLFRGGRTNGR